MGSARTDFLLRPVTLRDWDELKQTRDSVAAMVWVGKPGVRTLMHYDPDPNAWIVRRERIQERVRILKIP